MTWKLIGALIIQERYRHIFQRKSKLHLLSLTLLLTAFKCLNFAVWALKNVTLTQVASSTLQPEGQSGKELQSALPFLSSRTALLNFDVQTFRISD